MTREYAQKIAVVAGVGALLGAGIYVYWRIHQQVEDPVPSNTVVEYRQQKTVIATLGRYFDLENFKCHLCKVDIRKKNLEFRSNQTVPNNPLCLDCYMDENHPHCTVCNKTLYERCVKALGNLYHKSCFTCSKCHCPFSECEYYVLDDQPYDVTCYHMTKYGHLFSAK